MIDPSFQNNNTCRPNELSTNGNNRLSSLIEKRNKDRYEGDCSRQSRYLNANNDMVLNPEYKWMVPMPKPPVCVPFEKNEYNPLIEQSSLIGTLLPDARNTSVGSMLSYTPTHY